MNLTEEISKYKNIVKEEWDYGKGIYDKAPVKTVSSSTNGPLKNVKAEDKEPTPAKLTPVKKEEIVQPKEFRSARDKKPGPFTKKAKVEEAWNKEMKTPESKKGMFKGKTKDELKSELSAAKERSKKLHDADKSEPESLKTKIKELEFALRAKNKFGKVSESVDMKRCKGCGKKTKSKYCSDDCRAEYLKSYLNSMTKAPSIANEREFNQGWSAALDEVCEYIIGAGYPKLAKELRENF